MTAFIHATLDVTTNHADFIARKAKKSARRGSRMSDLAEMLASAKEQGYKEGRADGRKEAILYARKLIKIFWKDWNKTSHKKLPYLAFEELDEHILEQADESNGRDFMQWYKE